MTDLDSLSLDELMALQKQVADAIANFQARRRAEALAAVEAAARDHGFTLAELTEASAVSIKPEPRPAKYRHPENPALTWSGRGRQPRWVKEALAAGKSLDELLARLSSA